MLGPKGFCGATIEGYFAMLSQTCHNRIFTEMSEALAWLGLPVRDPLPRDSAGAAGTSAEYADPGRRVSQPPAAQSEAVTLDGARALGSRRARCSVS